MRFKCIHSPKAVTHVFAVFFTLEKIMLSVRDDNSACELLKYECITHEMFKEIFQFNEIIIGDALSSIVGMLR